MTPFRAVIHRAPATSGTPPARRFDTRAGGETPRPPVDDRQRPVAGEAAHQMTGNPPRPLENVSGLALPAALLVWLGLAATGRSAFLPGLILGPPVTLVVAGPVLLSAARNRTFDLGDIVRIGLGLRLIGMAARYVFVTEIERSSDAGVYHRNGVRLAAAYRDLDFGADPGRDIPGTGSVRAFAGGVYAVVGDHIILGFLVVTLLSFVGTFCLYRAFEVAFPDADHRRYALLIMLWPSLLFWPSSLGKDGLMVFSIGVGALGAARVLAHRRGGFGFFVLGLLGTALVRPHITMMLFAGLFAGYIVRRPAHPTLTALLAKFAGVAVLVGIGLVVVTQAERFFEIEDRSAEAVFSTLDNTTDRSGQGNTAFDPVDSTKPALYPWAVVTVLLRPFPGEVGGFLGLVTAAEGVLLVAVLLSGRHMLRSVWRRLRAQPYVAFVVVYIALFCFAFAAIGNFGILTRQRTQVMGLVLVLPVLGRATTAVRRRGDPRGEPVASTEMGKGARPAPNALAAQYRANRDHDIILGSGARMHERRGR